MRNSSGLKRRILLFAISAIAALSVRAQTGPMWTELGPTAPASLANNWQGIGRVNCLAISEKNPDLMFLGTARGGIWKTVDGGANWMHVDVPGFPVFGVSDIAIASSNDSVIYVATGDAETGLNDSLFYDARSFGVLKSTDGGVTWTQTLLPGDFDYYRSESRLWVDPRKATNLVVLSNAHPIGGIWRSNDGGATYTDLEMGRFRDLVGNASTPDILFATTQGIGYGVDVYKSVSGERWEETGAIDQSVRLPIGRMRLAVTKSNVNLLIAVSSIYQSGRLGHVFVSHDQGITFDTLPSIKNLLGYAADGSDTIGPGVFALSAEISPTNENEWYIGGANLWRSTNAGATWILSAHHAGQSAPLLRGNHHFIKHHPARNIVYTCHDGGIAQSTDKGLTWKDISKGLKIQQGYRLTVSKSNPDLTITGGDGSGTLLTLDGANFRAVLGNDCRDNAIDPNDPQILYVGTEGGMFRRSDDGGATWKVILSPAMIGDTGTAYVAPIVTHPTISGTIYVGYSQVYKSTDYGLTWKSISALQADGYIRHIAIYPSNSNTIYVATSYRVFVTRNAGSSWTRIEGLDRAYIYCLIAHPTDPQRAWVASGVIGGSVHEINAGVVTMIPSGFSPTWESYSLAYVPGTPGRLFMGTDDGLFAKNDGDGMWLSYGVNRPRAAITDIEYVAAKDVLRVSTNGRGLWEVPVAFCSTTRKRITALTPTIVCFGDTIILDAPLGNWYAWSNGSSESSSARRLVLTNTDQGGRYTLRIADEAGCMVYDTIVVTIKPSPPRPTIERIGDELLSSEIEALRYQWYRNETAIAGATMRTFTVPGNGSFTVETYNVHDCASQRSEPWDFQAGSDVASSDIVNRPLLVQPNPTQADVHIQLPTVVSRTLEVLDVRGTIVARLAIDDDLTMYSASLTALASGTYYVRIRSGAISWNAIVVRL